LVWIEQLFSSELIDHFWEAFLEKGVNDIRFWLEIITRAEQEKLIERLRWEWFEEEIKPWEIIFKKWDDIIIIKNNGWEEEAKKLRDYIWIDKFKQELEEVRASWDKEKIAKMELRVTSELLMHISSSLNYYLGNNDINWYQPKKILETKQIVCVGFSIIWHSLLSELWIKHNWLNLLVHSALEVIIWDKKYLFDATQHNYLLEFKEEKILYYTKMELVWEVTSSKGLYVSWDVEKILLSQIYTNKWNNLNILWRYEEAIKMYDKAIKLNPNNDLVYSNKWKAFYRLWKERMGKLYEFTGNLLSWYYFHFDVLNGERKQIRDFIKEKNYEWLRLYLLSLEKLGEE
jgi:tetratricopeptide (TPR) repeat protein